MCGRHQAMPTTTSRISHNLPDFPCSTAIAARRHLSALLSSSHFVTTVVSSPDSHSSSSAPQIAPSSDPSLPLPDPPQETAEFYSAQASPLPSTPSQISAQPSQEDLSALIEPLVKLQAPSRARSSKRPSSFVKARGFLSSKFFQSPVIVLGEPSLTQNVTDGTGFASHRQRRCRSSWRSLKRMGNRLVPPFRSMGLCMTGGGGAMACCDLSANGSSPELSWCSSGDYPPDFIRAVLENNVLLGYPAVD